MNRGGKGNGFVTKLTNGKFMAKMPAGTYPNGQTRYRTKTCATRPLANKALREMVHQSEAHQLIAGPEVKFRDFATQITFHQERVSVRTATEYLRLLRKWVFPVFGGRPIRDITASEAQAFLHQLRLKRSASTVNSVRTAMSAVFTAAEKLELVVFNPMRRTEKARTQLYEKTQVEEPWSVEEVNHVRHALANKPLEPIIMLLLMTGMRIGEALALEWSDIDLVDGHVNINKTMSHLSILQPDGGSLHKADVRPPKTKAGYRSIDIPEPMVAILQRYKLEQDLQRSCQGGEWQDLDLVFTNEIGGYINVSNLRRRYKKTLTQLGIRVIRLHDIRHTFATVLLEADGGHLAAVSRTLGHSKSDITLNRYGSTAKIEHQATSAMSDILFPGEFKGQRFQEFDKQAKERRVTISEFWSTGQGPRRV